MILKIFFLLSSLLPAHYLFAIPDFILRSIDIQPNSWRATQQFIQNNVSFIVNEPGRPHVNAYAQFVRMCKTWRAQEYACFFNYHLYNQHITEQQILSAYELYQYTAFQEYLRILHGYKEHIEQLYTHIDCGKKCTQKVRHIVGLKRNQFKQIVKKLHQELQNVRKQQEQHAKQIQQQHEALRKQQEKQRTGVRDAQQAVMMQQHDQLIILSAMWQDVTDDCDTPLAKHYQLRSEAVANSNDHWYEQSYVVSPVVHKALTERNLSADKFGMLYGNALQHVLHKEFVTVVDDTAHAYGKYQYLSAARNLSNTIFEFADIGREYNLHGAVAQASELADFCWVALDCIKAIGEGFCEGVENTVNMVLHPRKTATNIVKGVGMLAYQIGHMVYEVTELAILLDTNYEAAENKWDDMSNRFDSVLQAIQEKQKDLELRDYFKGAAAFATEWYLQARLVRGLGTLYESAQKQVPKLVSKFGEYRPDKKFLLSTAEGVEVSIAEEATIFIKKDGGKLNNLLEHESQALSLAKEQDSLFQKICEIIKGIEKKKGAPLPGYKGGRSFQNYDNILPKGISYKEYDIYPYIQGQNRGAERLVLGSDGSAWYTCDHYKTFSRIK